MASTNLGVTPWFATSNLVSAEMRYALAALVQSPAAANIGTETGVFPSVSGMTVNVVSGTRVSVAPGACALQTAVGGTYIVTVDTTTNVDVTAQASNSRRDLVCVRVMDSEAGDGLGQTIQGRLLTVEGAPGASPTVPATPAGYLVLAHLLVNSGGITVTDQRQFTRAAGGVRVATANDNRNGSYPGDERTWASGRKDVWTGSTWLTVVSPAAWTQENATFSYAGAGSIAAGSVSVGTGGSATVRYKRAGNDLNVQWLLQLGSSGVSGGAGQITTTLPAGMTAARSAWFPCHLFTPEDPPNGAPRVDVSGMAFVAATTNIVYPFFPIGIIQSSGIDLREAPLTNTDSTGVRGHGVPLIPNGFPVFTGGNMVIGTGLVEVQ